MPIWLRSGTRSRGAPSPSACGPSCSGKPSNNCSLAIASPASPSIQENHGIAAMANARCQKDSHALRVRVWQRRFGGRNIGEGSATMIDHISVGVSDLERSAKFYEAILATLGLARLVTRPRTIGFGKAYPEFWINLREGTSRVPPESG